MLKGKNIQLRYLEQSDLDFLYDIENDEKLWKFGSERHHFSKKVLTEYISNAKQDIEISKQLRFVIDYNQAPIGMIDLYDFEAKVAGVGVLILEKYRRRGFAKESLKLLSKYAFSTLKLKKLFCSITTDNKKSIKLFTSVAFKLKSKIKGVNYYILSK
ncbi:MAG: GNAT family N-acetyltransferase [Flavobacteriales bacterium]